MNEAANQQVGIKASFVGPTGSGKSFTAALLALGLAKHYEDRRPVGFFDTHGQSDFYEDIFRLEGVPLVSARGRSFAEMRTALTHCESEGFSGLIIDSYEDPWRELNAALRRRAGMTGRRLQIHHRDELAAIWSLWVARFVSSPLHIFLVGRLTHDDPDDETTTSKPRGQTAGAEAHLIVEMDVLHHPLAHVKTRRRGSQVHTCYVVKDRSMRLNGQTFRFRDVNDYREGDYKRVLDAFGPHIEALRDSTNTPPPTFNSVTSDELFVPGTADADAYQQARRIKIAIEEIEGVYGALWPGRTNQEGLLKNAATEALFGTRSWTAVEQLPASLVEHAAFTMRGLEAMLKAGEKVESPEALQRLIERLKFGQTPSDSEPNEGTVDNA